MRTSQFWRSSFDQCNPEIVGAICPALGKRVNSSYLAAELVCVFEFSPELSEEEGAELAVPPIVLGSGDLKPVLQCHHS
jgi:hypothetical protein